MILIVASSIVRLASSLYLPSLIAIGKDLYMPEDMLRYTLIIFFVVYAISNLFIGPLVDYFGRKELILTGSLIFIFGSFLCGMAHSSFLLFTGRVLQAIGTSCIPVSSRAMIRDYCSDIEVIKVLGWLAGIGGIIPVLAPAIGGIITQALGWRYNFYFLILLSFLAFLYAFFKLPKTLSKSNSIKISYVLNSYYKIVFSPEFSIVILPLALAFALQGIFLVSTPFIFMKYYGLTPFEYGLTNIVIASSLFFGRYIALFFMRKVSIYFSYFVGAFLTFLGGILIFCFIKLNILNIPLVLFSMFISVSGFGTLLPIGIKSIMTSFREKSGIVSGLHGFITVAMMALGSYIFSIIKDSLGFTYILTLSFFIIFMGVLIMISSAFSKNYLK
jgi:DHA1 family bicyclomycin/chloramphenicol resistance-like MFS transporter